jgi:hypothetical protein
MQPRQRFVLASFLLACTAAAGGLVFWNLPARGAAQEPVKRPRALVQIARQPPKVLSAPVENAEEYGRSLKTQVALIKSQLVLESALRSNEVRQLPAITSRPDPRAWLQQNLEVTILPDTEVLQVAMAAGSGASATDQVALINAVVQAYLEESIDTNTKRRMERYDMLKNIKEEYGKVLMEHRKRLRKLSETVGRDEPLKNLERESLPRLYHDLRAQRVKLRLERAEAETILARRKKVERAPLDVIHKEIAQLEDRLAVLISQEKGLDEELERMTLHLRRDNSSLVSNTLDLAALKDEIAQVENKARQVASEVETLSIELRAPSRVRLIERAVVPSP